MTTLSTTGIEQVLRTQLLTHARLFSADTLATILGATDEGAGLDAKLYVHRAPDNVDAVTPIRWGVMRLQNRRSNAENAERELAELEVLLFGRPNNQRAALEQAADCCDEAMLRFDLSGDDGRVGCWGSLRSTMPVFPEPADRDVVQIRCVYSLVIWPAYRTQYSATQ